MSDNARERQTKRSSLVQVDDAAGSAVLGGADPRDRRDFLRRLAMSGVAIPVIGGTTFAADRKAKKDKKSSSKSSAESAVSSSRVQSSSKKTQATNSARSSQHHASQVEESIGTGRGASAGVAAADPAVNEQAVNTQPLRDLHTGLNLAEFQQIQTDENSHVAFLVAALGSMARPKPTFQNIEVNNVHDFAMMARDFENTGVGAYLGALPLLAGTALGLTYLPAAGALALIEGRHSGYLNYLNNLNLAENVLGNIASIEQPLTPDQVVSIVSPYVASLNGGPPLIPAGGLVEAVDILNFALTLEYLESSFYNLNIPSLSAILAKGQALI